MANTSNNTPATERGAHPLNALTPAEIEAAVGIVRAWGGWTGTTKFETVRLHYPDKAECRTEIAAGRAGGSRKAYVSIYDTAADSVSELVVDLVGGAVEWATDVPGARPAINVDELMVCAETVPQHPDFIAAMARRGVTDLSNIQVDPFSAGNFGFGDEGRPAAGALPGLSARRSGGQRLCPPGRGPERAVRPEPRRGRARHRPCGPQGADGVFELPGRAAGDRGESFAAT